MINFSIVSILMVLLVGSLIGGMDFAIFSQLTETMEKINASLQVAQ